MARTPGSQNRTPLIRALDSLAKAAARLAREARASERDAQRVQERVENHKRRSYP
jgi:hypothetical protein